MTSAATEVPSAAVSDSFIVWTQPLVTTGLLLMSLVTAPLTGYGAGLYASVLLGVCTAHAYSRSLPDRWVPARARLGAAVLGSLTAGLLVGVASNTWAVGFAYVVAGHVGFRFPARVAVSLAGLTAGAAVLTLLLGPHLPGSDWAWWTGLTVAGPVVGGLARQNRLRTLAGAREVVEATRRASASEAEASALVERNRIARELHDVLAHSLSGVSLQLDTADALIEAGRVAEGRASLQAARGLAVDGLVQARHAVQALREEAFDLPAALSASIQGPAERLVVEGPVSALPVPLARAVLRIVQESLTNARRHAPGAACVVTVETGTSLRVRVVNGPPPRPVAPFELGSGLGLVGIRERAAALGGSVQAGPASGGWQVVVDLPCHRAP